MPPGGVGGPGEASSARSRPSTTASSCARTPGRRSPRSPETDGLDDQARAAVRLAIRDRDRALRVPEALVRELSEACSRCVTAWVEAREADDFAAYAGPLARVVELKRREAEAIGIGDEPYDALLDAFEPGATARELEPVFADLRARLTPLVARAAAAEPAELPERTWDEDGQMAVAREIAEMVGFDLAPRASSRGRPTRSPAAATAATSASRRAPTRRAR